MVKWLRGAPVRKFIRSRRVEHTSFYWKPVYKFYMDVQAYLVLLYSFTDCVPRRSISVATSTYVCLQERMYVPIYVCTCLGTFGRTFMRMYSITLCTCASVAYVGANNRKGQEHRKKKTENRKGQTLLWCYKVRLLSQSATGITKCDWG